MIFWAFWRRVRSSCILLWMSEYASCGSRTLGLGDLVMPSLQSQDARSDDGHEGWGCCGDGLAELSGFRSKLSCGFDLGWDAWAKSRAHDGAPGGVLESPDIGSARSV